MAAAASTGWRSAGGRGRSSARSLHAAALGNFNRSNESFGPCVSASVCCVSSGLMVSGVGLLIASLDNHRDERLAEYHNVVKRWTSGEREEFADARFNVTARIVLNSGARDIGFDIRGSEESPNVATRAMTSVIDTQDGSQWALRDTEAGKGVDQYVPLKFVSSFEIPVLQGIDNSTVNLRDWKPLPVRNEATALELEFTSWGPSGIVSNFSLQPLPRLFDQVVTSINPAPSAKCASQQHGTWHDRRCHVVRRLTHVCALVQFDSTNGWNLHHTGLENRPSFQNSALGAHAEPVGCHMSSGWAPAVYVADRCVEPSPFPRKECSDVDTRRSVVDVVLRSKEDPMVAAEVLTGDSFDFGMSHGSQLVIGSILLALGVLLSLPVVVRLCRHRKRSQLEEEELTQLGHGVTRMGTI
eukprot:TRINITY_DN42422_c0_g1_i1.p1 TRINITY_DN42422_c0_g1~~TRINITY_DN42422_c0_g1_i1.p1  ORF type:complete len:456 (-),score=67.89 TRINITY_DN42422_c0_g1_i1:57-1295(-)